MREEVIERYHRHLLEDKGLESGFFQRLKEKMSAYRMLYGDRAIGISLRPHFLTSGQFAKLVRYSEVLSGAFVRMSQIMLEKPELMDELGLSERMKRLSLIDPGYSVPAVNTRLDAFIDGNEIKYVEYNAENPSSLPDQPVLNNIMFDVEAMQRVSEVYRLKQYSPVAKLMESLVETFREWGGAGVPNIAIVDWADLPTGHEFIVLRNYFVGQGIPTIICTPDELEYRNGKLYRGDFRVDLVYKRIIIHELLDNFDDDHALIKSYINGDVCLINPFRCKLLHKKAGFAILTDEKYEQWFTPEEREVIRDSIPWTRRVIDRRAHYRGRDEDLLELIRRERAGFILKPNDDYGGHGIYIGKSMSESDWEQSIQKALAADYVVQELIDLTTEEFPIFTETEWDLQKMYVDTNPFLFRGKVEGAMVRLSDSPVVNVTSGGGEAGLFVVEGKV